MRESLVQRDREFDRARFWVSAASVVAWDLRLAIGLGIRFGRSAAGNLRLKFTAEIAHGNCPGKYAEQTATLTIQFTGGALVLSPTDHLCARARCILASTIRAVQTA